MAMTVRELKDWLKSLKDDDLVGIDEGGLAIQVQYNNDVYLEIGGVEGPDIAECRGCHRVFTQEEARTLKFISDPDDDVGRGRCPDCDSTVAPVFE